MSTTSSPTPMPVLAYGLLGLIPFLAPPIVGALAPSARPLAVGVLAVYAALILSFLGGARWGLAVSQRAPKASVVTLAMLPTLAAMAILVGLAHSPRLQLLAFAAALAIHWFWDMRGQDLPAWYASLRTTLTLGAAVGLIAGAALAGG